MTYSEVPGGVLSFHGFAFVPSPLAFATDFAAAGFAVAFAAGLAFVAGFAFFAVLFLAGAIAHSPHDQRSTEDTLAA
jgi:hypothetical protein